MSRRTTITNHERAFIGVMLLQALHGMASRNWQRSALGGVGNSSRVISDSQIP